MNSLDREINGTVLTPPYSVYALITLIRTLSDDLCHSQAKTKTNFTKYIMKQSATHFQKDNKFSIYHFKDGQLDFHMISYYLLYPPSALRRQEDAHEVGPRPEHGGRVPPQETTSPRAAVSRIARSISRRTDSSNSSGAGDAGPERISAVPAPSPPSIRSETAPG